MEGTDEEVAAPTGRVDDSEALALSAQLCWIELSERRRERVIEDVLLDEPRSLQQCEALANVRADRLQHSELRFIEIARALMLRPAFLLLDEPAAGLSVHEIGRLGEWIQAVARNGTGVLLVEHHADMIFGICDYVTVLNLGRVLAAGTPSQIRTNKEVVSAYLGG